MTIPVRAIAAALLSAAIALPATIVAGVPVAAASIPSAVGDCVNGWREVPIPDSVFLSAPFSVLTRDGEPAWILGGTNSGVLALRYDGAAWKQEAASAGGHRGLVGGTILGGSKVLGVGYYRPTAGEGEGALKPVAGKVVGSTWKSRPVPDPPGERASLTDVVSQPSGVAWAVGTRLESGRLRAYVLRWSGSRWRPKEPPAGSGSGLLSVERDPSGTIWAAGWKETSLGRPRPYIVKRVDGAWKAVKTAPLAASVAVITDLQFRGADDGYAVGYFAPKGSDKYRTMLQHWNGNRWSMVELPWADDFSAMPRSLSVGADGRILIAGTQPANDRREPRGFIASLDGAGWKLSFLEVPADIRSEVMAIAATNEGAVAAANIGGSLLVLEACGEPGPALAGKSLPGSKAKVSRGRVTVGNMKARRASLKADMRHIEEGHAIPDDRAIDASSISLAGGSSGVVALPKPAEHPAFWVKNMAAASGLTEWTKTYDGFAADFDGNGYRDVFYSRHGGVLPRLAMNGPGGFSNASSSAFSSVDRHGCTSGDVDKDGARDILCAVGASRGKATKRHELSLAPNKARGELARDTLGISDPLGRGRYAAVFRLDKDRYPEVFIANAPDRDDGWPGYNRFYRNKGGQVRARPGGRARFLPRSRVRGGHRRRQGWRRGPGLLHAVRLRRPRRRIAPHAQREGCAQGPHRGTGHRADRRHRRGLRRRERRRQA